MSRIKEAKSELRQLMKTRLEKLSLEETRRQSEAVCRRFCESSWFQNSRRLSVYVSTRGEIETDSIIKTALELGKEVFIPQFTKGSSSMEMVRVQDESAFNSLPVTLWGIRQPNPEWKWAPFQTSGPLDVIVTPGVAFHPSGFRCGHGKGYYDRFFSSHYSLFPTSQPVKLGLALREQIVIDLPTSNTDVQLDRVIYDGLENCDTK